MQLYQSNILKNFANVSHAFTAKNGGVSIKPYSSLNLAFHVNDDEKSVRQNHQLLANKLGYDYKKVVHMKQIHSNIVHTVTQSDDFNNPPTCDALITDKKNTPLMVMVADCTPLLFYDPTNEVIAVAHAGRTGAFTNIVQNVVDSFKNDYKSEVKNICVAIGSSIGVCCYEVGREIYEEAKKLKLEYAIEKRGKSYFLDVNKILLAQLLEAGVKKENIENIGVCSSCHKEEFFSYRAEGVTGRFGGVITLL